ncbi:MAG TPA: cytochrome c [Stellaceae bacterium]|nr:cytochrome c [Stellaceae bacterium]
MLKGLVVGIVLTLAALAAATYVIVTTGVIPAAARGGGPLPLERWAARSSLRATLTADAPQGPDPAPLTDANLITGIKLYAEHCAICHGTAKGAAAPSPIAKGEYPPPPQLATDGVEDDPEGWTYWKIQNGIRWTGMPAWHDTLSTEQMWALVLFLKHMDKLPPAAAASWQQVGQPATSP